MKKNLALILIFTFSNIDAQHIEWGKSFGGDSIEVGFDIKFDSEKNVYLIGRYERICDFDPSSSTFNLTANGSTDGYITKLDQNGNFIWTKSIGGTGGDDAFRFVIDNNDNIIIVGRYEDTCDFDPGPSTYELSAWSGSSYNTYILKLDKEGEFVWAKSFGSTSETDHLGIDIDGENNIYLTGYYNYTVSFGIDGFARAVHSVGSSIDIFVSKLDQNGNFKWVKSIGGSGYDNGVDIKVFNNKVYVIGGFRNTVDFDPDIGVENIVSNGISSSGFLLELDIDGGFKWVKSFDDINFSSFTMDNDSNLYLTGHFEGDVDFDPSSSTSNKTSNGHWDAFILKLNNNGEFIWVNSYGSDSSDRFNHIDIDLNNNIYTCGSFSKTVDFDNSSDNYFLTSKGVGDIILNKWNSDGDFIWTKSIGGSGNDLGSRLYVDEPRNIYLLGGFEKSIKVTSKNTLISRGKQDVVVLNVRECRDNIDTSITKNGNILTVNESGLSYQWKNCDNGMNINNANGKSFTVTETGNYSCIISEGSCEYVTRCINVKIDNGSSISSSFIHNSLTIYPNPTISDIFINSQFVIKQVEIRNIDSKLVYSNPYNSKDIHIDISRLQDGIYFITILDIVGNTTIQKIIVAS